VRSEELKAPATPSLVIGYWLLGCLRHCFFNFSSLIKKMALQSNAYQNYSLSTVNSSLKKQRKPKPFTIHHSPFTKILPINKTAESRRFGRAKRIRRHKTFLELSIFKKIQVALELVKRKLFSLFDVWHGQTYVLIGGAYGAPEFSILNSQFSIKNLPTQNRARSPKC